ncbi:hypothetical protein RHMOL_Rhmol05G0042300 [Rhododendron molle]|uniref:Uncharacterized protein n=1 Tax=Rhododendron molle TaxID=49168 RepID=A0ACC0NK90_RHOML|nr:hypothetical protein RHMOL_Rhmol05G0042300 [Rhododendron molle]
MFGGSVIDVFSNNIEAWDVRGLEAQTCIEVSACISSWRGVKRIGVNLALCSRWRFSTRIFDSRY